MEEGAVGLIDGGGFVDVAISDGGVQYQDIGRDGNKYNDGSGVRRHREGRGRGSYLTLWGSISSASNSGEKKWEEEEGEEEEGEGELEESRG